MPMSAVAPQHYPALLASKVDTVSGIMAPFSPPAPQVYPSPPTDFRLRAEFRMWHEGDTINYVMYRREDPRTPVVITEFPIADQCIQAAMPLLHTVVNANDTLRRKLFQVEFLAGLSGELLVTLIYHRKLDDEWEAAAQTLISELLPVAPALSIIGRSRKQKRVIGRDYIQEILPLSTREFHYRQYEQAFSQPNGRVNIQMIEWACDKARALAGDLLELYCGNGNFTLPLSEHFGHVIATELSKVSIRAARANLADNAISNVHLLRMSAEEVTQAMNAERIFRRVSELPKPLEQFELNTLFVDPPRAGLDEHTAAMASRFQTIIYISCNPQSLAENMRALDATHRIEHFAMFDQFPYTDHMECGVILKRK
ncbi:tRNA/tmRNA (uracil-C(5))-methyltransferase [Halioglobus japonicus]|nr:tRNA/tmRNA (uracil-C(5))-methyltransferase [Halioglobus japonicus]